MGKRFKFNTDKKLKFLFVGGTIYRKGIDILLQAYVRTFNGLDNVSLIIKDMGGDSFYAGQTAKNQIDIIQKSENSPEIIYIDDYFTEEQMVELYKACDVFVCPYRGEGFSLPTLEAMASGLPVIVTKGGSTDDFVDESIGWLISADKKSIGREIGGLPLTGEAYLLEPNEDELVETMKSIYGDPSQIFSKGLLASLRARTEWTWKKATIKLLARLDLHNGTTMAKIAEKNLEDYRDDAIALGEIEKKIIAKDSESAYSDLKKLLRNTNMTGRLLHHAYCRMAELCINLMKLDEVDQYLRKAREIYSSIDELYLEANKNFAEEKYSDALDGATKAMQNWKDDKYDSTIGLNIQELLSFTADTLLNDEDPNGALLIYLEVLKLNNNNANAYFGAGISHLKMGSNDDALRMFEWALRINPDYEMAKKMIDGLKITK
jgi:tetratricopeptide (TPR) repeat protein